MSTTEANDAFDELLGEVTQRFAGEPLVPLKRALGLLKEHDDPVDRVRAVRAARAASLLVDLQLDPASVTACLLVPVLVRDDGTIDPSIETGADHDTLHLVESVGRIKAIRWRELGAESLENLRRMVLAIASDVRVILIALADRLETLRSPETLDKDERHHVAREAKEVFGPLANRLGIWQLKWQLEDLSLRELDPETYQELSRLLAESREQRDAYIRDMIELLNDELRSASIKAEITGRPKHIYSIYRKMQRKHVGFDEIYDMSAVRVLVDQVRDCYAVLGLVHGMWAPIPGEFDDYIAKPKENLYQSLHTAVVGPQGKTLEIQIRTHDMHKYAEHGVAAHWAYKEGRRSATGDRQVHVLRQLIDWQKDMADPAHMADAIKSDLFDDRVYAFTPGGDVVDLPAGATPLDFAYRIHTQVGHRCAGARIGDQIVPLDREIKTGDRVEILTGNRGGPSRDWLNPHLGFVHTSGARQKIRQWFRKQGRETSIAQGRDLVDREMAKLGVKEFDLGALAPELGYKKAEDLLAAVGFGDVGPHRVGAKALDFERKDDEGDEPEVIAESPRSSAPSDARGVSIDGVGNVMSQPARCCNPVPGDPVLGYISRGRGIVIHHRNCPNLRNRSEPERFLDIEWGASHRARYPVTLRVRARDRRGLVRDVAEVISSAGLDIRATTTEVLAPGEEAVVSATVEAEHSEQVVRVIDRLTRVPEVFEVRRVRH